MTMPKTNAAPKRLLTMRTQHKASGPKAHTHRRDCIFFVDITTRKLRTESARRLWKALSKHTCRLQSDAELLSCFEHASPRSVWLSADTKALSPLANFIAVSNTEHRLLVFSEVAESTRHFLSAYFRRVLVTKDSAQYLAPAELAEVLAAPNRSDLFIGGTVDSKEQAVILYRGTVDPIVVPLDWFVSQSKNGPKADPKAFGICDYGQTVRLGAFEASADAILFEFDSAFRRKRKKDLLKQDNSFGASIRRLRLQKNLRRSEFPGISEKTIARIERNEISNPQSHTIAVIANRLGVKEGDLQTY